MRRTFVALTVLAVALALPGAGAFADHDAPSFSAPSPVATTSFNSGGVEGVEWEHIASFFTGNPHSDIDFFTQNGEMYVAAGVLGTGPNGGGQQIFQLTQDGEVDPVYVSAHPSAACGADLSRILGLQHDVEAAPKGDVLLNTNWGDLADRRDAQILVDATDAIGRCHDQGALFGVADGPRGGLEFIDITDIENPFEIVLTSHIGEAHTVNVDPSRPWIAYAVSSDSITTSGPEDATSAGEFTRNNEDPESTQRFNLDGFEVVDFSSCMDLPESMSPEEKRAECRPDVYRYRYPDIEMALGHTNPTVHGCHELEIYPNDMLTCGAGGALIVLDMGGVFDENGRPRGEPLPCRVRESSNAGAAEAWTTDAPIVDCVVGENGDGEDVDLTIPGWIDIGAPSLEGVEWVGTVYHMGRESATGAIDPAFPADEDIDFNHEAEFTHSGRFLLATDERGGGVLPPGASCSSGIDNPAGNGGIHAYATDRLRTSHTFDHEEAWEAYALTPEGEKAVFRAEVRTGAELVECTAHVFQQIPDQNRIFMGWYSQGTQVLDYVEHPDGTFEWREIAWWIPEHANQWTSHVFQYEENEDGSWTYYGVASDFQIGNGRNAIEIYKVTLPPPVQFSPGFGQDPVFSAAPDDDDPVGAPDDDEDEASALPATGAGFGALSLLVLAAAAAYGRRRR